MCVGDRPVCEIYHMASFIFRFTYITLFHPTVEFQCFVGGCKIKHISARRHRRYRCVDTVSFKDKVCFDYIKVAGRFKLTQTFFIIKIIISS